MIPLGLLFDAITWSNLLVLMSIGLTFTYITLKTPNFAHGDFVTIGAYTAFTLFDLIGLNIYLSLPLAFVIAGVVAILAYLLIFYPLFKRKAGVAVMMLAYLAAEAIIWCSLAIYSGIMTTYRGKPYLGFVVRDIYINLLGTKVPGALIASSILVIVTVVGLHLLFTKSKFGIGLKAAIENPDLASAVGIDVDKAYAISWFLAGGLTGLAGPIAATRFPFGPAIGWYYILRIFAACMLGGISSIWGAVIGAYIVGLSEVIGIYYLSMPPINLSLVYRVLIPFGILIATLMIIPEGLVSLNWADIRQRVFKYIKFRF